MTRFSEQPRHPGPSTVKTAVCLNVEVPKKQNRAFSRTALPSAIIKPVHVLVLTVSLSLQSTTPTRCGGKDVSNVSSESRIRTKMCIPEQSGPDNTLAQENLSVRLFVSIVYQVDKTLLFLEAQSIAVQQSTWGSSSAFISKNVCGGPFPFSVVSIRRVLRHFRGSANLKISPYVSQISPQSSCRPLSNVNWVRKSPSAVQVGRSKMYCPCKTSRDAPQIAGGMDLTLRGFRAWDRSFVCCKICREMQRRFEQSSCRVSVQMVMCSRR